MYTATIGKNMDLSKEKLINRKYFENIIVPENKEI